LSGCSAAAKLHPFHQAPDSEWFFWREGRIVNESQIEQITRINVYEFLVSIGVHQISSLRFMLGELLKPTARRFAEHVVVFDQWVGCLGLQAAAQKFLSGYIAGLEVSGQEGIPAEGPVVILSNHPGMSDTLALFSSIPRPDLKVIAQDRPFLRAMVQTSQKLIYVPDNIEGRMEVLHSVRQHLRQGGAVLTFPAGRIEPDPRVMQGAPAALSQWSKSISLFVRMVPHALIIPAVVSGVVNAGALGHPLTHLRKLPKDRERLAATLQIIANAVLPDLWPVRVQVEYGHGIPAQELASLGSPDSITQVVIDHVHGLMDTVAGREWMVEPRTPVMAQ
jgi:1-acyl-sn-glycerol-3-phosphate acyltransferase